MNEMNAVGWFDVYVEDMDRAVGFYENVLGTKLVLMDDPTHEALMMSFSGDMHAYGAAGALVKTQHSKPGPGGTQVYFLVEDCALQQARAADAGGVVIRPKFSIGQFGFVVLCEDTEGNVIGFNSLK
jgi:predicted enzyme related to lactoylglutathione lyase